MGGGLATYVKTMAQALAVRGHRVEVVSKGDKGKSSFEHDQSVNVHYVKLGSIHYYLSKIPFLGNILALPLRQIEWGFLIWKKVREIHRQTPLDVIEGPELGNLFNVLFLRRVPILLRSHGSTYFFKKHTGERIHFGEWLDRKIESLILKRSHAISVPSRFKRNEVHRCLQDLSTKIHVIPNPLPLELSNCERELIPLEKPDNEKPTSILYAGRLASVKGIFTLLNAASKVLSRFPETRFLLAGGAHGSIALEKINRIIREKHLERNVVLYGHVPWKKLLNHYAQATLFVMPSFYEAFGISCLEAMAFGLPVVATATGGLPEVVEDGVTGVLVPPGDSQALAQAVIGLLRDPHLRQRLGRAGRERVLAEFTVDQIFTRALGVYEQVIRQ